MKLSSMLVLVGAVLWLTPGVADAQPAPEDPVHAALRKVRDGLIEAVNKNDLDQLLAPLHKNVVVTWMDGTVSRGRDGVRAYYEKMMKGDQRIVDRLQINPAVDELSILYGGDTAIAFGSSDDDFKLKRGLEFKVHNRWTATLVKEDGQWRIAAFHASVSLFDNPLLSAAEKLAYWAGGIAGVVGLGLGWLGARWLRKRTP